MSIAPWQLQIVKRSLKKKEKLDLIRKHVHIKPTDLVLDLGCAQGILSFFLRQKGGTWISTDLDFTNLKSSQSVLGDNLVQMGVPALPFKDGAFDQVVCLDYLEHVDDDAGTLAEIRRVLKPGGRLLVLEFSKVWAPLKGPYDAYSFGLLPRLGKLVADDEASYRYLAESIRMHPDQETLKAMMLAAGFDKVDYFNLTAGVVALHRGFKY